MLANRYVIFKNVHKPKGIKNPKGQPYYVNEQFKWTTEPLNVFRVTASNDSIDIITINMNQIIAKVNTVINFWTNRDSPC